MDSSCFVCMNLLSILRPKTEAPVSKERCVSDDMQGLVLSKLSYIITILEKILTF